MIDIEQIKKYKFPSSIDFKDEERRLREKNIVELQKTTSYFFQNPSLFEDFENMNSKSFKTKYRYLVLQDSEFYHKIKNLILKVTNYCNNFGLDKKYLLTLIHNDSIIRNSFIIDYKKQNPYESFVCKYFKYLENDLNLIRNFEHIPVSGPKALYIYNGLIQNEEIKESVQNTPPSVDFIWQYTFNNKTCYFYATHKFTSGTGTAQKNQMRDIEKYLDHSKQNSNKNNFFFAWMDGDYYTNHNYPNYKPSEIILEHIKKIYENDKIKIVTSYSFIYTLIFTIRNWLQVNFNEEIIKEELYKLELILKLSNNVICN